MGINRTKLTEEQMDKILMKYLPSIAYTRTKETVINISINEVFEIMQICYTRGYDRDIAKAVNKQIK